jgi:hypothetical protein
MVRDARGDSYIDEIHEWGYLKPYGEALCNVCL